MTEKLLLLGDQAIALGAIHAGISGVYAYPGTPSTEITEYIQESPLAKERGLHSLWCANEKTAMEAALGMSYAGKRALVCMKHVGLNVAADAFVNSSMTGVNGGLVVLAADDPSMHSSQNEQDSRFYGKFAFMPMLEPSSQQEAYEMIRYAFDFSEKTRLPVLMRITTRMAHSRAAVTTTPAREENSLSFPEDRARWILLPVNARRRYGELLAAQDGLEKESETTHYNKYIKGGKKGVLACGIGYNYLMENLMGSDPAGLENPTGPDGAENPTGPHGLENPTGANGAEDLTGTCDPDGAENFAGGQNPPGRDNPTILKISQYPLPVKLVRRLVDECDEVLILEDGQPFVEEQVRGLLDPSGKIRGRLSGELPRVGELNPDNVRAALGLKPAPCAEACGIVTPRPPALCAGCGHRDVYEALNEVIREYPEAKVFSDIGCYTLGALPPLRTIDSCVDMGASITMAKGAADAGLFPSLAVIGDSTFTHSGITGLLDAVNSGSNITVVISDNLTTAMTGGQDSAGTGRLEDICIGVGVNPEHVKVVVPLPRNMEEIKSVIREEINYNGVSVIIPRRECIQTLKRKRK